ncbi:FxsA family protein [Desulfomicrobium baculatum]|uniref:FxsA cytoplasmic membrane protein n=1 Tax=Desulfomicrobium baculatum (strain DSM 4028 / VKM B-1378 / X) TaxID=525897 RepID=C7LV87_DESBD|nr:FxsA family protein [Desulfomicrobium baculatum]ACU91091.1 FxsA cytoplasmic membrane protein [Desulfomicrobium baculatum DSM 4028]
MFGKLFLLFVLVPVAEIYLLVTVGGVIGALPTVALVILTALAGAHLARMQGMSTMLRIRENLDQGFMPAEELLDGVLIFLAGVVLLTPGFLTDIAGLLILLPATRNLFKQWLRKKFDEWRQNPNVHITFHR